MKRENTSTSSYRYSNKHEAIYLTPCKGNCKFGTIDNVGISTRNEKSKVELINYVLENNPSMKVVMLHITDITSNVELIKKNFEVINIVKIPIGYSNSYQYHIHIRNTFDETYKNRFEKDGVISETLKYSKQLPVTSNQLEEAFRAGRKDKSYHIKSGFKKFITKDK